jgi:hypothetical protein
MTFEKDLAKVQALEPGQSCTVFWFEEGGGHVEREGDLLVLHEVPQYGGVEGDEFTFNLDQAAALVRLAHTWT